MTLLSRNKGAGPERDTQTTRRERASRGRSRRAFLEDARVAGHASRFFRFGLVGASGVLVNYAVLYALAEVAGLHHLLAAAAATEAAILSNFFLNDRWTFRDTKPAVSWPRRVLRYNSVASLGLVISVAVLAGLTYLSGLHYLIANLFAIGAGTLWNYAGSLRFAWAAEKSGRHPSAGGLLAAFLDRCCGFIAPLRRRRSSRVRGRVCPPRRSARRAVRTARLFWLFGRRGGGER